MPTCLHTAAPVQRRVCSHLSHDAPRILPHARMEAQRVQDARSLYLDDLTKQVTSRPPQLFFFLFFFSFNGLILFIFFCRTLQFASFVYSASPSTLVSRLRRFLHRLAA